MARKAFNLSAEIRSVIAANKDITFAELWAKLTSTRRGVNEGTAKATFYKLRGSKKRKVRRLKPGANGTGDHMTAALKFVRACGSVDVAKAQLAAVGQLLAVVRETE